MTDKKEPKHCDEYINSFKAPDCLRWFLFINRMPATEKNLCNRNGVNPKLFAKYKGEWVRVVMASRFGDVGITTHLDADFGYLNRVSVEDLTDFSAERPDRATRRRMNSKRK